MLRKKNPYTNIIKIQVEAIDLLIISMIIGGVELYAF